MLKLEHFSATPKGHCTHIALDKLKARTFAAITQLGKAAGEKRTTLLGDGAALYRYRAMQLL